MFSGRNRQKKPGARPNFEFFKDRRVGTYYFYILDPDFGPSFVKLCTYRPWPGKVWLNGHEWVGDARSHATSEHAGLEVRLMS